MRIVTLRVRSAEDWEALRRGDAWFIPSTTALTAGETVLLDIRSARLPNPVFVRAKAQSWQAAMPRARVRAGSEVVIPASENEKITFVNEMLRGNREAFRRRFPRFPITASGQLFIGDSPLAIPAEIVEIGAGGAVITAPIRLHTGNAVRLEVVVPPAITPTVIAARVSYHTANLGMGLQFVTKNVEGKRRLLELVRRLTNAADVDILNGNVTTQNNTNSNSGTGQ